MNIWKYVLVGLVLTITIACHGQNIHQEGAYVLHPHQLFFNEDCVFNSYDGMWADDATLRKDQFTLQHAKPQIEKSNGRIQLIYKAQNAQGHGKKVVTLSPDGYTIDYEHQIKPIKGYGEIGFYIPVEFLTPDDGVITILGPKEKRIKLPTDPSNEPKPQDILHIMGGGKIIIQGKHFIEISLEGMKDTYGGRLQDFRGTPSHAHAHSLRFLVSWSTQRATHVQGRVHIRVMDKKEASALLSDQSRLHIQASSPYFVTTGETIHIPVQFERPAPGEEGILHWRLVNESHAIEKKGTINIPGETSHWQHELNLKMTRNGSYRLEMQLTAGDHTWRDESLFSVFPPPLDRGRSSSDILGASGIFEKYSDLAIICGLTWNRRWCGTGDTRVEHAFRKNVPDSGYLNQAADWEGKNGFIPLGSLTARVGGHFKNDWGDRTADEMYINEWIENYVKPLVRQTSDHIRYWEVLNEPYYQLREHPEIYAEILKRTYIAIKSIDPTLKVVGVCGPPDSIGDKWYRDVFSRGAMKYMDVLSFHQYCFSNQLVSNPEQRFEGWFSHLRQLMQQYGGHELPLWNDEASVTPPATMFTLKRYLKNVRYGSGYQSPDPRGQAAVMSRLLTVHYAYKVKYFFHLFSTSPTYSCHPMEYNGAPLPLAVAISGAHHFLEGKRPIGIDNSHKRLPIYLFAGKGNQRVIVCWLRQFYPNETAEFNWPTAWENIQKYDIFANSVDKNSHSVGPEPIFLTFNSGLSDADLLNQVRNIKVGLRQTEPDKVKQIGTLESAQPSDWVGYVPVDIKSYVNRGFADQTAGDQNGGFTDEGINDLRALPSGDYKSHGVPFQIIDPQNNDDKGCIVLGSQLRKYFPMQVNGIKVNRRFTKMSFFHLITNGYRSKGKVVLTYVIHYADGTSETIPVREGDNIADWWSHDALPHARIAFEIPNQLTDRVSVFQYDWTSSNPNGAAARITTIDIHSADESAVPVVLAITGTLSN